VIRGRCFIEDPRCHLVHAGVHHVFIKHLDELAPADGHQEVFEPAESRLVAVADGDP
jgi:hypothetical protein